VAGVALGGLHSLAVGTHGEVTAWGASENGATGLSGAGTSGNARTPAAIPKISCRQVCRQTDRRIDRRTDGRTDTHPLEPYALDGCTDG
jgi:alpha-tubulin suppressor-like RCC1 family protein